MNLVSKELNVGSKKIIIESGKLAKQSNAAVTVTCGGTVVLVAACMAPKAKSDASFFPLLVEYVEKTYSAGRIPGGFFKREGRPTQKEILTSRIIDRPLRPLFPEGFLNDVVISCTVLSSDGENDPDVLALLGSSCALMISDIPFDGPVAGIRVGLIDDQLVINPTYEERQNSVMELFVVGHENGIVMIEGEAFEASEAKVIEALEFAEKQFAAIRDFQKELQSEIGKEKVEVELFAVNSALKGKISEMTKSRLEEIYRIADKGERETALASLIDEVTGDLSVFESCLEEGKAISEGEVRNLIDGVEYEVVRNMVFTESKRADGRGLKELRELTSEINVLPRTHGASLFTRGQTQSLAVVTLGSKRDEQMIESLEGVEYNNFMLHYNFPPFSVGEARGTRGPGRREIGHGALAAKALAAVLPSKEDFPYTIRIVSEILESNGSSSMASVCAGTLSLMTAGVPIKNPVAGISIGLLLGETPDQYVLLTDIMGLEDHFGDMDYKIAGTKDGITAIQLDLKVKGISLEILSKGLEQAKEARMQILENMANTISEPNPEVSEFAPRIQITQVPQDKIGEVIGPGGKMIKKIMEETGAESIDIDDDGKVVISAVNKEAAVKAATFIDKLMEVPVIGKIYDAVVTRVENFGLFCEFLPGKSGLCHVSEFSTEYVKDITKIVKVGDTFKVKLVEIDKMKRINLSIKQAQES